MQQDRVKGSKSHTDVKAYVWKKHRYARSTEIWKHVHLCVLLVSVKCTDFNRSENRSWHSWLLPSCSAGRFLTFVSFQLDVFHTPHSFFFFFFCHHVMSHSTFNNVLLLFPSGVCTLPKTKVPMENPLATALNSHFELWMCIFGDLVVCHILFELRCGKAMCYFPPEKQQQHLNSERVGILYEM